MMMTRTGMPISVSLFDENGNRKELGLKEFRLVMDTKKNFGTILGSMLRHRDAAGLLLLSVLALKRLAKGDIAREKEILFRRQIGFAGKQIQIKFGASTIRMDLEKNPYMQVLYQVGSIFIKNSYNLDAETIRGKTVVDAGANIGLFSFLAAAMGAKRVYAFEPVDGTYRLLCKNISENRLEGIVVPVQKALGKETGTATIWYDSAGDLTAEIGQCRNKKRSSTIELVSVDSHLAGDELSFLKIDSEGFEKEILLGTKESIGRWKPVLSFSAYHKPEDKDELPRLVKSIRKDYDVKTINFGEDNIYAC